MNKKINLAIIILIVLPSVFSDLGFDVGLTLLMPDSCYDGIQNQDETDIDCGGVCPACESIHTSSGGSGSSGSYIPINNTQNDTNNNVFSKTFFSIKKEEEILLNLTDSDLALVAIIATFKKDLKNITFLAEKKEPGIEVKEQPLSEYDYQYFKISAYNLATEDIAQLRLIFRIDKAWIEEKNQTFAEFLLLQYLNDWQPLITEFTYNDSEHYYFEAKTNSIGHFSIIGELPEEIVLDNRTSPNPFKRFLEIPGNILNPNGDIPQINFILFTLTAILVILTSGAIVYFKHKNKKVIKIHKIDLSKEEETSRKVRKKIDEINKRLKRL